jgi:hypothetical protein
VGWCLATPVTQRRFEQGVIPTEIARRAEARRLEARSVQNSGVYQSHRTECAIHTPAAVAVVDSYGGTGVPVIAANENYTRPQRHHSQQRLRDARLTRAQRLMAGVGVMSRSKMKKGRSHSAAPGSHNLSAHCFASGCATDSAAVTTVPEGRYQHCRGTTLMGRLRTEACLACRVATPGTLLR